MVAPASLIESVRAWMAVDPDPDTRAELESLLAADDTAALAERFDGRLQFGTAGLRGAIGAGPMRMNRVTVRRAAWGLVRYLLDTVPGAADTGIVIGYDARTNSDVFARDTAAVAAELGMRSVLIGGVVPTPVLAFQVSELGAAAGVMVTASHNPPQDNGYKVYLPDGSQIISPHDTEISARIDRAPADVPVAADDDALISVMTVADARRPYLAQLPAGTAGVTVAYTPLHGVGGEVLMEGFAHAGLPTPYVVAEQFAPDRHFPTVAFPNPEEPGAMDLVMQLAADHGAGLALANDPDADRLAAAIPTPDGGWRRLGGDELGWLLADHVLRTTSGDDRLVVTTVVSSSLLGKMAAAHGVQYAETFTGFKWIAATIRQYPNARPVFAYEQSLGYLVSPRPLDKDGISAAVVMASLAADAAAKGETLQGRLDALAERYGRHVIVDHSVAMAPAAGKAAVAAVRDSAPTTLGGHPVTDVVWFDEAGLLRIECGAAGRVQLRPSGTEPKVKIYAEGVDTDPTALLEAAVALIA